MASASRLQKQHDACIWTNGKLRRRVYLTERSSWLLALIVVTEGMDPTRCHHLTLVKMPWSVKAHIENDWSSSGKGNTCVQLCALHGSIPASVLNPAALDRECRVKCLLRSHFILLLGTRRAADRLLPHTLLTNSYVPTLESVVAFGTLSIK